MPVKLHNVVHTIGSQEGTNDMFNMDNVDLQVLRKLQEDGRVTMKALAEEVGLSSPAMIERVRRLEEREVLQGYRALVNPRAVGRSLTALINVSLDRADYDAFLEALREQSAVEECHRVTGDQAFVVKAHVASTEDLEMLIDELQQVGAKCSTNIVLSTPIANAAIMPPDGTVTDKSRATRRRRRTRQQRMVEQG
jgi:Lrp/AsnC family leucine-responsive transcriptional regulator